MSCQPFRAAELNIWISFLSFVRLHRQDSFRMSGPMLGTYVWRCQLHLHLTIDLY
jgi:hypothetical protein